jgi:hypothetical protein
VEKPSSVLAIGFRDRGSAHGKVRTRNMITTCYLSAMVRCFLAPSKPPPVICESIPVLPRLPLTWKFRCLRGKK